MKLENFVKKNYPTIQAFVDDLSKKVGRKLPHETVRHYVHGTRNPKPYIAKGIISLAHRKCARMSMEDLIIDRRSGQ